MPFAGYQNFQACVQANAKMRDPRAYCATIMRKVEARPTKVRQPKKSRG